jgi:hypothetical protein
MNTENYQKNPFKRNCISDLVAAAATRQMTSSGQVWAFLKSACISYLRLVITAHDSVKNK